MRGVQWLFCDLWLHSAHPDSRVWHAQLCALQGRLPCLTHATVLAALQLEHAMSALRTCWKLHQVAGLQSKPDGVLARQQALVQAAALRGCWQGARHLRQQRGWLAARRRLQRPLWCHRAAAAARGLVSGGLTSHPGVWSTQQQPGCRILLLGYAWWQVLGTSLCSDSP